MLNVLVVETTYSEFITSTSVIVTLQLIVVFIAIDSYAFVWFKFLNHTFFVYLQDDVKPSELDLPIETTYILHCSFIMSL